MKVASGKAGENDADELLALINLVQPHIPWDSQRLHWQFFSPPAGPARLYVVRESGRIVSLYAAVPLAVQHAGGVRRSFMIQDVMTHPKYRGRGYLHELGRICFADLRAGGDLGHTFPNERSEGSFRRNGWTALCRVPEWTMALAEHSGSHARVQPCDAFGAQADEIWAEAGLDTGVRRDCAYLEWRYSKPGVAYQRYAIEGDRGFLVLKLYSGDRKLLHICELVVRASARGLIPGVLRFCFSTGYRLGAQTLTAWLPPQHPYAAAFAAAGLGFQRGNRTVFVTAPADLLPGLGEERRWLLTQGDSDVY